MCFKKEKSYKRGQILKNFRKYEKKNSVSDETSYELSFKNGDNFCGKLKIVQKTIV
jgi:hypothetical protein